MAELFQSWIENWDRPPVTAIAAFLTLLIFDNLVCKSLYDVVSPSKKSDSKSKRKPPQKSRWFALHTFANLIVCISAIKPFIATILDPAHSADASRYPDVGLFGNASNFPLVMIIAVHFYHMAIFTDLNSADYFHHLMFIPTMGIPGLVWNWGPCQAFLCVFISGLPGGIEYFCLTLNKLGLVTDRAVLKKIGALQNAWIRWPGILIGGYHIYMGWVYGTLQAPWYFAFMVSGLSSFNAIYYGFQSISALTKTSIVARYVSVAAGYSCSVFLPC